MIRCRPYNPRAQGTVEKSHKVFRQKITYDFMTQKTFGVNWAKNLPEYMKCLNNEKREALGWKNPFEIYFSGKFKLIKESLDAQDDTIYEKVYEVPTASDYQKQYEQNVKVSEKARTKCKGIDESI